MNGNCNIKGYNVTNANVVPYNKYLLTKFNCHINVEVCTSVKSVKYIFKYIYKGYDCAEVQITDNNDIDQYINSRYVSAPEAMWRLMEYKMHDRSHKINRLPVHLPREQMVVFEEGREEEAVRNSDLQQTQLLAWFKLNEEDSAARNYFYNEIPLHYTYVNGVWKKRKNVYTKILTRLYAVPPSDKERFFLRLLLLNVKGATSFEDLRTFNDVVYSTFEEAAEKRGLLINDNEWDRVLEEAANTQPPVSIRNLFGYICAFNQPRNPKMLFDKYYEDMIEDFKETNNAEDRLLSIIKDIVNSHGWSMRSLELQEPCAYIREQAKKSISNSEDVETMIKSLNVDQNRAFNEIVDNIDKRGNLLYLDGPAGTGKTYLYNVLCSYLKSKNKSTIQLATTGIAADLLQEGRTMHSVMKLPVPLTESSISRLQRNTPEAERVIKASLILIDEISMMSKFALEAINEVLKRLMDSPDIFGGKTILLGGDFRQTSNIVLKGSPMDIIENSLLSSRLWKHCKVLRLSVNMRAYNQSEFSKWLLEIGNGTSNDANDEVLIPDKYIEMHDLVIKIFGQAKISQSDPSVLDKVILSAKNDHANKINEEVIQLVEGNLKTYVGADSIVTEDANEFMRFPQEFLNKQQPSGLPPHKLNLKVGSVIMLLRNLDPQNGLLNGTRLWVKELKEHFIVGEIITGKAKGKIGVIPRIDMQPSDTLLPFVLKRRQFPVVLSYAITIHKAQGQSFEKVGVYLPEPVFTHGQLYVALSRIRHENNLSIFLSSDSSNKTKNIVFKELLRKN